MAWLRRRQAKGSGENLEPSELGVELSPQRCEQALQQLFDNLEADGGVERYVAALKMKSELFGRLLAPEALSQLDEEARDTVLERVFSARRRLAPHLREMEVADFRSLVGELLHGKGDLEERMEAFVEALPCEGKACRARRDLAADLLHFYDPERYPLMTRWVWDVNTDSGALRELVPHSDQIERLPTGGEPGVFLTLRDWVKEQLEAQAFYRDLDLMADLLLAQVYAQYIKAMAEGMLRTDFGGNSEDPSEHVRKLLGIDEQRLKGRSRLKGETEG
ncbi:MAG: hypothetical protein ACLFRB_04900 [Thiohalorhabdus sp.]|uniref:hypothetical protein n=1 Tax=Thiohalorhabdus sp. TaxID=3094134 RepID=UPI00398076F5